MEEEEEEDAGGGGGIDGDGGGWLTKLQRTRPSLRKPRWRTQACSSALERHSLADEAHRSKQVSAKEEEGEGEAASKCERGTETERETAMDSEGRLDHN